jgi:hypothetical protein
MGHIAQQIALLSTLAAWDRAEKAAQLFPAITDQQAKAARLHARLCEIAIACGFSPGREHRHLTTVAWARKRADTLSRVFPNHAHEGDSHV